MANCLKLFKMMPSVLAKSRFNVVKRQIAQTNWHFQKLLDEPKKATLVEKQKVSNNQDMHQSKMDRSLVEFLTAEIIEERRVQYQLEPPYMIEDYAIVFRGSEIELIKEAPNETITVVCNVSKSVPPHNDEEAANDGEDVMPVRSAPRFEVLIKRGESVLSIFCTFNSTAFKNEREPFSKIDPPPEEMTPEEKHNEVFQILEMCLFDNSWNEFVYTIEGSMIDDCLYHLIMEMLEEKGISNEFAIKISDLATAHEHASYIQFLENLNKFAVGIPKPVKCISSK